MATNRVRACAKKVTCFHERFESRFGRTEARSHSLIYLQGLILGEGRKNVERIALRFSTARDGSPPTQNEVVALQEFLTLSPWQAAACSRRSRPCSPKSSCRAPPRGRSEPWASWMNRRSSKAVPKAAAWRDNGAAGWARKKTARSVST